MSIAVISDVHAGKEALDVFLSDVYNNRQITEIINLGDVIDYGADPTYCLETCIKMEKDGTMKNIKGNHDAVVLGEFSDIFVKFNPFAQMSVIWTSQQLKEEHIQAIRKWPIQIIDKDIAYVHGRPISNESFSPFEKMNALSHYSTYWFNKGTQEYEKGFVQTTFSIMKNSNLRVCFVGHYHRQEAYCLKDNAPVEDCQEISASPEKDLEIKPDYLYIINPGSLGQPRIRRDGDELKAGYLVFDRKNKVISFVRKDYDRKLSAEKMRQVQALAPQYADLTEFGEIKKN